MRSVQRISIVLLSAVLLASCSRQPAPSSNEPITLFPPHTASDVTDSTERTPSGEKEARTQQHRDVNDTYGETAQVEGIGETADLSESYRTEDSYALEADALRAAKALFAKTLALPETLSVSDTRVTDTADDGACVYYRIYIDAAYRVQTGEQVSRGVFQSVGVRKKDRTAFDASDQIRDVLDAYSIYAASVRKTQTFCDPSDPDMDAAVRTIALSQLKKPDSGEFRSALHRDDVAQAERGWIIYDVVCVGTNDYGMQIPGVYTLYLVQDGSTIRQIDPTEP